ncbi:MAG: preprotein translocase subunit YajC [Prevotella sp.]|nr:preprotein translocase subunit YajC [Prevotella sp.]MCM1074197.1 preprotein translocase subunit YajC [Ruminococcus sp.]
MLNTILLQDQAGGGYTGILMIVAMVVIFYFFMIRPQNKKQKEIRKAREAMQKGDKVVTAGGIYGRIKEVKETTFMVEIAEGVIIKIEKTSVYADPGTPAPAAK